MLWNLSFSHFYLFTLLFSLSILLFFTIFSQFYYINICLLSGTSCFFFLLMCAQFSVSYLLMFLSDMSFSVCFRAIRGSKQSVCTLDWKTSARERGMKNAKKMATFFIIISLARHRHYVCECRCWLCWASLRSTLNHWTSRPSKLLNCPYYT